MTPRFGIKPNPKDSRDFKVGKSYSLPRIEDLPETFKIQPRFGVKDQKDSDYCSAFATSYMAELNEDVELSPEWQFMASKIISGDPDEWGQYPRVAMKVATKYGAIERESSPYSVEKDNYLEIRHQRLWPNLFKQAKKHLQRSYLEVDGPYDHFDNIKASIHKFESIVSFNMDFGYSLKTKYFEEFRKGFGHMLPIVGWTKEHLILLNQYGKEAGDKGFHYASREVVNKNVEKYGGVYILIDHDTESLKREQWSIWQKILDFLIKLFK